MSYNLQSQTLGFGNNSITATTTTRFLSPGFDSGTATTDQIDVILERGGTIQGLRIFHRSPAGNGNAIVYTALLDDIATTLTVSIASTAASGSDLVNSFTVVAGERLAIRVTKALAIGSTPNDIFASVEYL